MNANIQATKVGEMHSFDGSEASGFIRFRVNGGRTFDLPVTAVQLRTFMSGVTQAPSQKAPPKPPRDDGGLGAPVSTSTSRSAAYGSLDGLDDDEDPDNIMVLPHSLPFGHGDNLEEGL